MAVAGAEIHHRSAIAAGVEPVLVWMKWNEMRWDALGWDGRQSEDVAMDGMGLQGFQISGSSSRPDRCGGVLPLTGPLR